jgi:hypothetical protein
MAPMGLVGRCKADQPLTEGVARCRQGEATRGVEGSHTRTLQHLM